MTHRNLKPPKKIVIGGEMSNILRKIKDRVYNTLYKKPIHKQLDNTPSSNSNDNDLQDDYDFDKDFDNDNNIRGDPQKLFLDSLNNSIGEIDSLDLSVLGDYESTKLKNDMKKSISNLYEFSNNKLSDIHPGKLRALAGAILTKTFILQILSNCKQCPNINKNESIYRKNFVNSISTIISKPYIAFTKFEEAVKNAQPLKSNSESDSESDSDSE